MYTVVATVVVVFFPVYCTVEPVLKDHVTGHKNNVKTDGLW